QRLAAEFAAERVMCPMSGRTFRHEIAVLEQVRPVLLQPPLDRAGARLVRPDMNVADAPAHTCSIHRSGSDRQFRSRAFPDEQAASSVLPPVLAADENEDAGY